MTPMARSYHGKGSTGQTCDQLMANSFRRDQHAPLVTCAIGPLMESMIDPHLDG